MGRIAAVIVALGMAAQAGSAAAASCGPARGRVGEFDHYLLSLSWSPSFCATPAGAANPAQCAPLPRHGFVVHGLWPQYAKGGWPQCCRSGPPLSEAAVPRAVERVMIGRDLHRHQWSKHGSCATPHPEAYFDMIGKAVASFGLAEDLTPAKTGRIKVSELKAHWPALPPAAITVRCRGRELSEVRLCLDKSLAPMACPAAITEADNCPGTVVLR